MSASAEAVREYPLLGEHRLGPAEARVVRARGGYEVLGLFVPPRLRRRGHATALLRYLIERAAEEGVALRASPLAFGRNMTEEEIENFDGPYTSDLREFYRRLGLLR